MIDHRQQALLEWVHLKLAVAVELDPIVGDASFRRYFRIKSPKFQLIAMDSPPDKEDCRPFIQVAEHFRQLGLNVPDIIHADPEAGFLLISDFGQQLYYRELNLENVDQLYRAAIDDLLRLQVNPANHDGLPIFAKTMLQRELDFFTEWFLKQYLKLTLTPSEQSVLTTTYDFLLANAAAQPQVCVHRDYHSRNLMLLPNNQVGILDFQDAVIGPLTYDLVSLIRDCYIDWPEAKVKTWALYFYHQLRDLNRLTDISEAEFLHWFDLMGMQRHLKAIFIFARKSLRDHNPDYLQFIPRTLNYINAVCLQYPELKPFHAFLQQRILPAWNY